MAYLIAEVPFLVPFKRGAAIPKLREYPNTKDASIKPIK